MDKDHPLCSSIGRVWHHRHIASVMIGRWLARDEIVHHRDGNRSNNSPGNLVVTTMSKHATEHARLAGLNIKEVRECGFCKEEFYTVRGKFCSDRCRSMSRRSFEISKEKLERLVWEMPSTRVAKKFGVSDVAICKRCKSLGIIKPPRGYWSRDRADKVPDS